MNNHGNNWLNYGNPHQSWTFMIQSNLKSNPYISCFTLKCHVIKVNLIANALSCCLQM